MILCLLSFLVQFPLGLLYPIYSSLALVTKGAQSNEPEAQRWLSYWILYWIVSRAFCCEGCEYEYLDALWTILKMLVIVFLAVPQINGAKMVYDRLFKNMEETKASLRAMLKAAMERACACCGGCCGPKVK